MAFKGNVESFSLADVFQNLAMNSQTGTLRITPERNPNVEEKYVYFQDGRIRFLSGSSRASLLPADIFVARGILSKTDLDAAQTRQTQTSETLITALVGMNCVTETQIQDLLVRQIEEEIYDLFGWEAASFEFNEGPPPAGLFAAEATDAGWNINIQVSRLIMEAARRADEWERLSKIIGSQKKIFVVELNVRKAIERGEIATDPVERRVALLVDGARDVDDIIEDSKLFKFEVVGTLCELLQASSIRAATLNELNFSESECARLDLPKRRAKVLERILALGGENVRIRRELADLMAKMGQVEYACIHYGILASAELKENHDDNAIEIYKRILAIAPANVTTREALAALYAKRNQKRDAFVQYQELFDNLRDRHLLREARDAALNALENDPSNIKMRNALIDLLLMKDNHEEAGAQLELLGDIAARAHNTSLAADSYRRAMQHRKNTRPLKKKLNEVLLTKEDRTARRRRATLIIAATSVALCTFAVIYYIEMANQKTFDAAELEVATRQAHANALAKEGDLSAARVEISSALESLHAARKVWSPIRGLRSRAEDLYLGLQRQDEAFKIDLVTRDERIETTRADLRVEAKAAMESFDFKTAKVKLEQLLEKYDKTDEDKQLDRADLDKANKALDSYIEGRAKIARIQSDPAKAFKSAAEEMTFIRNFIKQYSLARLDDFPKTLNYPLLVTPLNVDEVDVEMDGNPIRTIRANAHWSERVLRYPIFPVHGSHIFRFSKRGYTSQTEDTTLHQDPTLAEVKVSLERKPAVLAQFQGVQFDGDARFFNGLLYAGTSEGALLEIDVKADPPAITAQYKLVQPLGGVEKRVYGQISVFKLPGKQPLFVYCTKAGYCVGLIKNNGKFESAWNQPPTKVLDSSQPALDFPPTFFEQGGKPKVALVTSTRIVVVDAETGTAVQLPMEMPISSVNKKPVTPTSGACFIDRRALERAEDVKEGDALAIAGSDGNIHVFNLATGTSKPKKSIWDTDLSKFATIVKTAPIVVGDTVVVAANNGAIRLFKLDGTRESAMREAAGGIVNPPLAVGKRVFFACAGTAAKEGLSVIDLTVSEFPLRSRNDIGIAFSPAILNKRLYFVTTPPNFLYSIDEKEINTVYWKYKLDRQAACPPVPSDSRIYVLTTDGGLIGFDEPQ